MPPASRKRKDDRLEGIFKNSLVFSKREISSFCAVFVHLPENFDQKKLGTLFGIIKIDNTSPENSYIPNLLSSVIKKEFFSKSERSSGESFEASLRKANLTLAELARRGSVGWTGKISFVGGTLERNNLNFSKLGKATILLLRNGMIADIGKGMGESSPGEDLDSHPLKTFVDISSGKLEKDDILILATNDLLDIYSLEELRQNASRFPIAEYFDILSASLKTNSELAGLIVANIVSEEVPPEKILYPEMQPYTPENPRKTSLVSTQKTSSSDQEKIPGYLDLKPEKKFNEKRVPDKERILVSEKDDIPNRKSFVDKFSLSFGKIKIWMSANFLPKRQVAISLLKKIFFFSSSKKSRPAYSIYNPIMDFFKKMSFFSWIGFTFAILFLAILFQFGLFKDKNTDEVLSPATDQKVNQALDDFQVKRVEKLDHLADLSEKSRDLIFFSNFLFVVNEEKSVSKINPENGEIEKIDANVGTGNFFLAAAMPDLNSIFIYTDDKKVLSFTPANKRFQENGIPLPNNATIKDIATFLTYLYVLDSDAGQIYRYPRAEGGFGEGQNWLRNGEEVKNAIGFAVNDNVFIAEKNLIAAYLQGRKDENINFESTKNPLLVEKIYSEPGLENIYILDKENRRIVQFSKAGKIVNQFFNPDISDVLDFSVDEKNKIIFILKNNQLLKFSMD